MIRATKGGQSYRLTSLAVQGEGRNHAMTDRVALAQLLEQSNRTSTEETLMQYEEEMSVRITKAVLGVSQCRLS